MRTVRAHDWRWKADGEAGYTDTATSLEHAPRLPDFGRVRDRAFAALFDQALAGTTTPETLELGCASAWLPYLALYRGCGVTGIDYEPSAVELTIANMGGAGARGTILCRNAFDVEANRELVKRFDHFDDLVQCLDAVVRYIKPSGALMTIVPNCRG